MLGFKKNLMTYFLFLQLMVGVSTSNAEDIIRYSESAPFELGVSDSESGYVRYWFECKEAEDYKLKNRKLFRIYLNLYIEKKHLLQIFGLSNLDHNIGGGVGGLRDLDLWIAIEFENSNKEKLSFKSEKFNFIAERIDYSSDRGADQWGWIAVFNLSLFPFDEKGNLFFSKLANSENVYISINSWDKAIYKIKMPDKMRGAAFNSISLGCGK